MEPDNQQTGQDIAYFPLGEGTRSLWVWGELVTYKLSSYQTGGAYSLFEITAWDRAGPPPHVQHREDEAFCVLEGEYEFMVEGRTISAATGSLIYVPKGKLHTHSNVTAGIGRMLVSQTPGGLHEGFFDEIGEESKDSIVPADFDDPAQMERIAKIAATYGIEILSPGRSYESEKVSTG